uniref:AlwI family type II restriction endonuclease n=1 Tax=Dictyoglomus turgidum TaxID=513050 RepID=A0A7C3SMZ6_9BACT
MKMKIPWSISTTVRNPERLRDFLSVLKRLEGQSFDANNQINYQILLIQERLYRPLNIPLKFRKYYEKPNMQIPFKVAKEIFYTQNYKDPPMRGRQSVNPLNKLGFSIAREGSGPIRITELGNRFLAGDYDIGFIFFKSLLKLQFPNPWSEDFSYQRGFNIMPFIATMHLIYRLNKKSSNKGLDKTEFSLFIPTLINVDEINEQIEKILEFRKEKDKKKYISNFAKKFYGVQKVPDKKIKNLFDYGDNIMRYFRLTRYFKVTMDPFGHYWRVDLEPSRKVEIELLLNMYDGKAIEFKDANEYLNYLSDITKPTLPWEEIENLKKIALSLRNTIIDLIKREDIAIFDNEKEFLNTNIAEFEKKQLEEYISELRKLNLEVREKLRKIRIVSDIEKIKDVINILCDIKKLKKYEPEHFEKLITEALKIINDEILIKPNYPVDDEGEPISYSPGNRPDIECYYKTFKAICEVTLNTSRFQWIQEGQPVMRHLRDFEIQHKGKEVFCIFIAPQIHNDTYSQFWISVKYEYDGLPQKIIPMTTKQFALLLDVLLQLIKQGKRFSHKELYDLYTQIINITKKLNSFSDWANCIQNVIKEWSQKSILL